MQMRPRDKCSNMQLIFSLQGYKEYIVICHFHGIYRYSCVHCTEESEVVNVPSAHCPVLWTCDENVAILDYFDSCHWASMVVEFCYLMKISWVNE